MSARNKAARWVVQRVLLGTVNCHEAVPHDVILTEDPPSMMAVVSTTDTPAAEVASCSGGASTS